MGLKEQLLHSYKRLYAPLSTMSSQLAGSVLIGVGIKRECGGVGERLERAQRPPASESGDRSCSHHSAAYSGKSESVQTGELNELI